MTLYRSKEELERIKRLLVADPESGEPDWFGFQALCVSRFGSAAGLQARHFTHLTGLSTKLEDGQFYKSRDEGCSETGQGHREWDNGIAILKGEKPWAGRAAKVLKAHRPSRRAPTVFQMDLFALSEEIGVVLPDLAPADLGFVDGLELQTPFDDAEEADPVESPRGATRNRDDDVGALPESPRGATESPRGAAESPHETAESPNGAASEVLTAVHTEGRAEECSAGASAASRRAARDDSTELEQGDDVEDFATPAQELEDVAPSDKHHAADEGSNETPDNHEAKPITMRDLFAPRAPEKPSISKEENSGVLRMVWDDPANGNPKTIPGCFALACARGEELDGTPVTPLMVAEKAREALGSRLPVDAYLSAVERALDALGADLPEEVGLHQTA